MSETKQDKVDCIPSGRQVFEKAKNAIVDIYTISPLIAVIDIGGGEVLEIEIFLIDIGSGFFIEDNFIVSTVHLTLLPPDILDAFGIPGITFVRNPPIVPGNPVQQRIILANIFNVLPCDRAFMYELDVVGFDGAADIAVLMINPHKEWNRTLPSICKHEHLTWGCSRERGPGSKVYVIGDPLDEDFRSISAGVVRNNRYVNQNDTAIDPSVAKFPNNPYRVIVESVLVDASIMPFNSGSCLLDEQGKVIGMGSFALITSLISSGFPPEAFAAVAENMGGGPSQFMMQPVVETLICAVKGNPNLHVRLFKDFNNIYGYVKGYLGIIWSVRDPSDLFTIFNLSCTQESKLPDPNQYKEIIGIIVLALDGDPNCPQVPSSGTPSPLLGVVEVGDLITHINDIPLGNIPPQIAPSLITWNLLPGNSVKITFRKQSESYNIPHTATVTLGTFPPQFDYPQSNFTSKGELKFGPIKNEKAAAIMEGVKKNWKKASKGMAFC